MTDKGIGFSRTIKLPWLNAAASLRHQINSLPELRAGLETVLLPELSGVDARRKTIDVLTGVWHKSAQVSPSLHAQALNMFAESANDQERLFVHYGLTLLYYPFFRHCSATLGRFARNGETPTRQMVKNKIAADLGHFGALDRSVERVIASLTDWGILNHIPETRAYLATPNKLIASDKAFESWLLACALKGQNQSQILFGDLIQSPFLFPFKFTLAIDHLRVDPRFNVQRQGEWDMLSLIENEKPV